MLYQIYKHEPEGEWLTCISDTIRTLMLYIAYDTPTSKCSCLSTILKIKSALLQNVRSCLYESTTAKYFGVNPPSVGDYFV